MRREASEIKGDPATDSEAERGPGREPELEKRAMGTLRLIKGDSQRPRRETEIESQAEGEAGKGRYVLGGEGAEAASPARSTCDGTEGVGVLTTAASGCGALCPPPCVLLQRRPRRQLGDPLLRHAVNVGSLLVLGPPHPGLALGNLQELKSRP